MIYFVILTSFTRNTNKHLTPIFGTYSKANQFKPRVISKLHSGKSRINAWFGAFEIVLRLLLMQIVQVDG